MSRKAAEAKSGGKGGKGGVAKGGAALPTQDEQGYSNFSAPDSTTTTILTVQNKKLYVHWLEVSL